MNVLFTPKAWEDYLYWQSHDKNLTKRIHQLIQHCQREPFKGVGKPEPLRFELSGCWSRRINTEHRLVYKVDDQTLIILQCRYHY
jgi:toxin YoeB